VTNAAGCISAATVSVIIVQTVIPSAPVTGVVTQPTCAVATGSVLLSGLPLPGSWTITASPGGATLNGSGTSATFSGLPAGTYTFTVTPTLSGCTSPASVSVVITALPATPSTPVVSTVTQPNCVVSTGSILLSGLPAGTWTINPGAITGSTTSTTISGLTAGSYSYKVTNSLGCISPASLVTINAIPNCAPIAINDVNTTAVDTPVNGNSSGNDTPNGNGSNVWSLIGTNGGAAHGTVSMFSNGTYTYTPNSKFSGIDIFNYKLCDMNGNCAQAIVTITIVDSVLPNQIFTPNNDGQNDTFTIPGIELYPNNKLTIYNRWGNIVYQKSGYLNEWDGYANTQKIGDAPLPVGTYFYVLNYGNQKTRTGFVYLDR